MRSLGGVELLDRHVVGDAIVNRLHTRSGRMPADPGEWQEALRGFDPMAEVYRLLDRARERPLLQGAIPGPAYITNTGSSAVALTAATAKTILYINAGANVDACISEMCVGFDGVTASAVPALVELVYGTKASNSTPGTNSTSFTPVQSRGWAVKTVAAAAANVCTSEPTVLVAHRQWLVTPNGGLLVIQFPLGKEPTAHNIASTSGLQIGVRVNAPATVNCRGYTEHDE